MEPMHADPGDRTIRDLARGGVLFAAGTSTGLWRIVSGALRVDRVDRGGTRFARLAMAGDCVGEETLAGAIHGSTARAVVRCRVERLCAPGRPDGRLLLGILERQDERFADMVRLRTGTTSDRLRVLFAMLAGEGASAVDAYVCPMPTLGDLAAIVDAAPETVSRVLGEFRREGVVRDRKRSTVIVDGRRLRSLAGPPGGRAPGQGRRRGDGRGGAETPVPGDRESSVAVPA